MITAAACWQRALQPRRSKVNRKLLLEKLGKVKSALASNDLIPALTHLWFSGDEVLAYNDAVGISTPCDAGITGMVPGATLLAMLQMSKAKEVEFVAGDGEVLVKAASAKIKLPLLPVDKPLFEMPEIKGGEVLPANSAEFVDAIAQCLRSVINDPSVPDQTGITVIPGKKMLTLFSTNGATISTVTVPITGEIALKRRVVLSEQFCERLVQLARGDKKAKLVLDEDSALLLTSDGTRLFGKLVEVEKPLDFHAQIADMVPKGIDDAAVPIPTMMARILDRALVVSDPTGEGAYTQIIVRGGRASFLTKSARGEIRDGMTLGDGQPDVTVSADPRWLKAGCADFAKMLVTKECVIMRGERSLYLVAPGA